MRAVRNLLRQSQQLKRIGSSIASLNSCCEDIRRHVAAAHRQTGPVLEEVSTLLSQKEDAETKKQLLGAFSKQFVLSDEDLEILVSSTALVDERFFGVLAQLKRIHKDCQVLLGYEDQQLGLELMDKCIRHLNLAFQKLFRWIQKEFKMLNLESPQINASMRRALRVMSERPALFQNCLDFFAESREHNLSTAFYLALTGLPRESGDPATKPIEYYAHDPLRFVGDMLAWTHSATVSEREALEVLFVSDGNDIAKGIQAGIDSEPWLQEAKEAFDGQKLLEQLVNRNLAGVARALRQRVDQVIQSDEDSVLAFKIANLIDFYRITFSRLLGSESSVLDMLAALRQSALRQFRKTMRDHTSSISAESAEYPPNLSTPGFLAEALKQLQELLRSHDSSLAPIEAKGIEFSPILIESLDPFLAVCEQIAETLSEPSTSIFAINCFSVVKATLAPYLFTADRVADLQVSIDQHASKLVEYQHAFFLHTSGLHPLIVALAPLSNSAHDSESLVTLESFRSDALSQTSQILDHFLPSALLDAMDHLTRLQSPRLAEAVTAEAVERFCQDFEFVEGKIVEADRVWSGGGGARDGADEGVNSEGDGDGLGRLRAVFPRTSPEIRVLLS